MRAGHESSLARAWTGAPARRATSTRRAQASGRFFAIPGRRGKPGGVGPVLRSTRKPGGDSSSSAGELLGDTRDGVQRPPIGPTQRTTAPPSATSGRHHSAATGGRRERLRHRDAVPVGRLLLGAAPDDAQVRQLARPALAGTRPCAAPPRAASPRGRAARPRAGCPGVPPPEPTSTIGPSKPAHELDARERVVEQHAPRLGRIAQRGQPGRREHRGEPALEDVRRRRGAGR